jgi:hypothetical protein
MATPDAFPKTCLRLFSNDCDHLHRKPVRLTVCITVYQRFLEKDGTLEKKGLPDYLRLRPESYEISGNAIKGDVQKLLKQR